MQARRLALVKATATVFIEHGYEGASLSMLALAADVTKATFYSHFSDKQTLFAAVLEYWLDELLIASSPPENRASLNVQLELADRSLRHPASHAFVCAVARSTDVPAVQLERWHQHLEKIVAHLTAAFSTAARGADPQLAARQFVTLVLGDLHLPRVIRREGGSGYADAVELFLRAYGADTSTGQ